MIVQIAEPNIAAHGMRDQEDGRARNTPDHGRNELMQVPLVRLESHGVAFLRIAQVAISGVCTF
jgi:hypothetical protein